MKVNVLLPSLKKIASGGYKVIYEYCNLLARDGVSITIYYFLGDTIKRYHLPEPIRAFLVKNYAIFIGPRKWFKLDRRIKNRVVEDTGNIRQADITIATSIKTAKPVLELPSRCGKKVYFIQGYENWDYSDNYVKSSYSFGMKNIVVSKWLQKLVDQYSKDPCVIVPNGIDGRIFYFKESNRQNHSIVFHYRSEVQKGCKYAIEVVQLLHERYPDLMVNIITIEKEFPVLPSYCHYYYNQTPQQVAEINRRSEVFICSTIDEGFGLPGLEAMACGCAVASTDYTGVHEYAIDGYNALLSPVRDSQAMADNVSKLFDDDELREKIVKNGIETGKEKSIDKSYQKFKDVLEELVKE